MGFPLCPAIQLLGKADLQSQLWNVCTPRLHEGMVAGGMVVPGCRRAALVRHHRVTCIWVQTAEVTMLFPLATRICPQAPCPLQGAWKGARRGFLSLQKPRVSWLGQSSFDFVSLLGNGVALSCTCCVMKSIFQHFEVWQEKKASIFYWLTLLGAGRSMAHEFIFKIWQGLLSCCWAWGWGIRDFQSMAATLSSSSLLKERTEIWEGSNVSTLFF